jgi:ribonuclease R
MTSGTLAEVELNGGETMLNVPLLGGAIAAPPEARVGDIYLVDAERRTPLERLALAGTARAEMFHIALVSGCELAFPPEVMREVSALDLATALRDPALEDFTAQPFVTIDGPTSKDLDQALYIEADAAGRYRVYYALADAAYFVKKGSALFAEALRRGASVYLPGFSVPMLPRQLSEGIVSLNPDGERRALLFIVDIASSGEVTSTRVTRARIRSRGKLSFPEVQAFYDGAPQGAHLGTSPAASSLRALRDAGELLMAEAKDREVTRYRRNETEWTFEGANGEALRLVRAPRLRVEMYNEQLSLLVNREGARILHESTLPFVEPIYRVHPAPPDERVAMLCATISAVTRVFGLEADPQFHFDPEREALANYLERLPREGAPGRIAAAIHRQAVIINARSSFSTDVGKHHGVGAEAYARFSAPMREVVGIFVHHEMLELLTQNGADDDNMLASVVESANTSKERQRKVNDHVQRYFLDALFGQDLAHAGQARPERVGTVMGFTSSKVHVSLDEPPLDVKLYLRDLGKQRGDKWLDVTDEGAALRERVSGESRSEVAAAAQPVLARLGDAVLVRVDDRDARHDRWVLSMRRVESTT